MKKNDFVPEIREDSDVKETVQKVPEEGTVIDAESLDTVETSNDVRVTMSPVTIEAGVIGLKGGNKQAFTPTKTRHLLPQSALEQSQSSTLSQNYPQESVHNTYNDLQNKSPVLMNTGEVVAGQYNRIDTLHSTPAFTNRTDVVEVQDTAMAASSPEWSPMSSHNNPDQYHWHDQQTE